MGTISPTLPTIGQPNSSEDPDVRNALSAIIGVINGGIDAANAPGLVQACLQLNVAGTHKIAFGTYSVSGTGTTFSANISHGLGVTPIFAVFQPQGLALTGRPWAVNIASMSSTIIAIQMQDTNGGIVSGATATGWWIAVS